MSIESRFVVFFRRVVQNDCGRLPYFPQATCIFHLGLVGFLNFRDTGFDAVDRGPDTICSTFLNAASVQVVA